jgi:hypothetical protein
MPILAVPVLLQLAASCPVHGVPDARMVATARVESSLELLAVHDNTARVTYPTPASAADAVALVKPLLAAGHSIDAGIMQVNSGNWARLGLTAETAFDPAANICAGKAVLAEAYAIERAVSCRYNAGRPNCTSRYPDRIEAALTTPDQVAPVATRAVVRPLEVLVDALHPGVRAVQMMISWSPLDAFPHAYKEAPR